MHDVIELAFSLGTTGGGDMGNIDYIGNRSYDMYKTV